MTPNQKAYQKELGRLQRANQRLGSSGLSESEFNKAFKAPARITKDDIKRLQNIKGKDLTSYKSVEDSDAFTMDAEALKNMAYNNLIDELNSAWEAAGDKHRWYKFFNDILDEISAADNELDDEEFTEYAKGLKESGARITTREMYEAESNERWIAESQAARSAAQERAANKNRKYEEDGFTVEYDEEGNAEYSDFEYDPYLF